MSAVSAERGGAGRSSLPRAALAALALEVLLVWAVIARLPRHSPPPREPARVALSFPVLPEPPTPKPAPPKPVAPPPKPVPKPTPKPPKPIRHRVVRRRAPSPQPKPAPQPVPIAAAEPQPDTLPAPVPPTPPAPPPPPSVDPSAAATFEGEVRAAVQAAVRYPYAARLAHLSGRARVAFRYRDAQVSRIALVTSSGSDLLDAAALRAVSAAHYPPPPPNLARKLLSFVIWVRFDLTESAD